MTINDFIENPCDLSFSSFPSNKSGKLFALSRFLAGGYKRVLKLLAIKMYSMTLRLGWIRFSMKKGFKLQLNHLL